MPCNYGFIFLDKTTSSSWELPQLQTELEGEAHMMQILKAKNDKCLGKMIFYEPGSNLIVSIYP